MEIQSYYMNNFEDKKRKNIQSAEEILFDVFKNNKNSNYRKTTNTSNRTPKKYLTVDYNDI